MRPVIWINGEEVPFSVAHVDFVCKDGKRVRITINGSHEQNSIRVGLIDDGSIETEAPLTEKRWRHIARHG